MYIPELDALIFLATEFLEGGDNQPTLESGISSLHEAAGTSYTPGQPTKRSKFASRLTRRGCIDLLEQLGIPLQDELLPVIWEAMGGTEDIPVVTVGLLLSLVCQADFDAKTSFVFWLLDKDGDHKLTKGDVLGAVGPLMHTAQTGIVFKGTLDPDVKDAASVWEDFRDSMRELATDQIAAAIATGAFDTVDTAHTGRIQEAQFRVMIECIATDVATMMVNVTEMQDQVEKASGSRLDSSSSPASGVKTALHKLVTKYAGDEVAERLLGRPAKPRRKSGVSAGRPPRFGSSSNSQQQASRFSPLRAGSTSQQPSTSRQGSGQLPSDPAFGASRQGSGQLASVPGRQGSAQVPAGPDLSAQALQSQWQGSSVMPQLSLTQQASSLESGTQGPQPNSPLPEGSTQPIWQSNLAYSPQGSVSSQQSGPNLQGTHLLKQGTASSQQAMPQGVQLTSTPNFLVSHSTSLATASQGTLLQQPSIPATASGIVYTSQPTLLDQAAGQTEASSSGQGSLGWPQGSLQQPQGSLQQPQSSLQQPQGSLQQSHGSDSRLLPEASSAAQQAEASTSGHQGMTSLRQLPPTASGMQRQGWFQNEAFDDAQDPNLHNPRDANAERQGSGALASPSSPSSPGPFDLSRMSGQVNAELQAQEEQRKKLRHERMRRADRAAAAANAAVKADFKAKEDAESASKIDPKHALITLAAGLTVRYYLMDIIKIMVILAVLLGDAAFVTALFARQRLSLELSLGIVFFFNIVLSMAALIYIVTGINTDIFIWVKDYLVSLKDDDSAVSQKKDTTLSKLAAMEGAVPKQLQPAYNKIIKKLQAAGKQGNKKKKKNDDDDDDDDSDADSLDRRSSQYGEEEGGAPSTPRSRLSGGSAKRIQFARRSRGVGQAGGSRQGGPGGRRQSGESQDYMSKAKQLWNYVGKFTGLETMGGGEHDAQDLSRQPSGHSRSFGRQWANVSSRSFRPGLGRSRLGRSTGPAGVADDYKSAALLARAEEGDSSAVQPSRIPSHANPILRDADSKNWQPNRRTNVSSAGQTNPAYEGLV